ncbi:MAG: V-type ATP synthase subunit E, partial [Gammaproteobacteria bacterium]|nr:V-type ATP synthase subunit E [Gammaproteobacteria bacterium]MBT3892308.1 V-type ATP synthase subunit E [Gammaproteobacteria bacterium]
MSRESNQTKSLQAAMIERAKKLATEHISQGNLSRQKIMQNAREKIHLMEQKELLLAKSLSEREYLRKVEAREIHLQAELDRNRWGLVQTVMEQLRHHLQTLQQQP